MLRPRTRILIAVATAVVLLLGGLGWMAGRIPFSSETLRGKAVGFLTDRLQADVELGELTIRLFPRVRVKGVGLRIRYADRRDVPPLISVDSFVAEADLIGLWRRRIHRVTLNGLDIQIAPKPRAESAETTEASESDAGSPPSDLPNRATASPAKDVIVEQVVADEARLVIIPRRPDKRPKVWQMHELRVQNVGIGQRMPFQTTLTNAVPPGRIDTAGSFGPWNVKEPELTPLEGEFTFERADLSFFKGIAGILSAHGGYGGSLGRIEVHGQTDTPDFTVKVGGHPVPLNTTYHAIVDGTNGDTALERVDATFVETSLVAKGGVFDVKGVPGRVVRLDITMEEGRLEDVMRLAVNTPQPPMSGRLHLQTKFVLPPGDRDVVERLELDGQFAIRGGRFSNHEVQTKIAELSRRASGKDKGNDNAKDTTKAPSRVASDFSGRFSLGKGTLALPAVAFDVPGAAVRLAGRYDLRAETMGFKGDLYMDAKISQTTTGWKALLLKIVDPFFRRQGKTVVPIKITGTRSKPEFGLDVGRVFGRGDSPAAPPPKRGRATRAPLPERPIPATPAAPATRSSDP